MLEGFATSEGTTNFARKSLAHEENFRKIIDLTLSNVGLGTYPNIRKCKIMNLSEILIVC